MAEDSLQSAEDYQLLAKDLLKTDKLKEAQKVVDKGLTKYPKDLQILVRNAEIADRGDNLDKRIDAWRKVLKISPKKAPAKAWIKLSRLENYKNSKENLKEARKIISKGIKKSKTKDISLYLEALLLAGQAEDWKTARKLWKTVSKLEGKLDSKQDADVPEMGYVFLAKAFMDKGDYSLAQEITEQGLAKFTDSSAIKFEHANTVTASQNWQQAQELWSANRELLEKSKDYGLFYQICKFNLSLLERLLNINDYNQSIADYQQSSKPKTVAVATSFSKGYDQLKPHAVLNDNFDYFVYTDFKVDDLGIYKPKELPNLKLDAGRLIRYVKMHPHVLFKDYDVAVWVDASIMISGDIQPLIDEFIKSGKAMASSQHSVRKNVYQEFDACIELKKDDPEIINKQRKFYESEGFKGEGLTENGFLMFNLKHPNLALVMEKWWEQVNKFSKRDQLSLGYSLEKTGTEIHLLLKQPQSVRNNDYFVTTQHGVDYPALNALVDKLD